MPCLFFGTLRSVFVNALDWLYFLSSNAVEAASTMPFQVEENRRNCLSIDAPGFEPFDDRL
jgi:hypothetical protein